MAANIYLYCPAETDGPFRCDLEHALENFFGGAAEDCGAEVGTSGFNLDYPLAGGEDVHAWADRLKIFLVGFGVRAGTKFDVFPDGWKPGMAWRHVEVFGEDRRQMENPVASSRA